MTMYHDMDHQIIIWRTTLQHCAAVFLPVIKQKIFNQFQKSQIFTGSNMHQALKRLTWSVLLERVLDAVEVLSLVPALTAAARRSYQAARTPPAYHLNKH